jgi:hypothetical protein
MECNMFTKMILWLSLIFFAAINGYADICFTRGTTINETAFELDKDTGLSINAWVKHDNIPAYTCYKNRRYNDNIKTKLHIRQIFRVVANNHRISSGGKQWSLLTKSTDNELRHEDIVGWVDDDNLIFNEHPLINPQTAIYEKALIREGDANGGQALRIFYDPELSRKREAIEVRTVFYVYDYYPRSASGPSSPETKSLLISPLSTLSIHGELEPLLVGWVDRSKVSFWNSRLAVDFPLNKSVTVKNESGQMLFRTENIRAPLAHNALRNPILGESADGKSYRIGVFSRLSTKDFNLRMLTEKINVGLEVMYVIDGTRSMTQAFKATLDGVASMVEVLRNYSNEYNIEEPRVGLLVYRDRKMIDPVRYDKQGRLIDVFDIADCEREISSYPLGNLDRFLSFLNKQIACDSDTTAPESVYMALKKAAQSKHWLKGEDGLPKRLRVIIHIGDAGDNGRQNLRASQLAALMKANHIYNYIAIDASPSASETAFKSTVLPLVKAFENNGTYINHPHEMVTAVSKSLFDSQRQVQKLDTQIDIISRGFAGTTEGRVGVISKEILEYAKNVIRANNIDLSKYSAFQQYIEGFVPKTTPLKKYLLVSRTNIENITNFMTQVIETSDLENKKSTWNSYLKLILGDEMCVRDGKELSIEECNRMRNGIPIKAGFMKYTREEFLNLGFDATKEMVCDAKITRERFRILVENKKATNVSMLDPDTCEFTILPSFDLNDDGFVVRNDQVSKQIGSELKYIRNARDTDFVDLYFFQEGGESVAWIPLEHLENVKLARLE